LRIEVSEDDLRRIAQTGYEGAASTDHDKQAQGRPVHQPYLDRTG
jgi:hypothetical protein